MFHFFAFIHFATFRLRFCVPVYRRACAPTVPVLQWCRCRQRCRCSNGACAANGVVASNCACVANGACASNCACAAGAAGVRCRHYFQDKRGIRFDFTFSFSLGKNLVFLISSASCGNQKNEGGFPRHRRKRYPISRKERAMFHFFLNQGIEERLPI